MMFIKVCGMREAENIAAVATLGIDYMGFIFYEKSKRFVGEDFDESRLKILGDSINKVGVFVNASLEYVKTKKDKYGLDVLQLHGDESPEYCAELVGEGVEIIKVFSVGTAFDFKKLKVYESLCDYFLFDTKSPARGGTGKSFNWEILKDYTGQKPVFLSGGISLENVAEVDMLKTVPIHALDVNSKFEFEPALKDVDKLRILVDKINKL